LLVKLAEHSRIQLIRVPRHTGIDWNETNDQSARPGSSHPLAGPKPALSTYEEVARK